MLFVPATRQRYEIVVHDAAVGDRARLVEIERIHACEGLHRVEVLHQRVLAGKANGGEREIE